MLSIDKNVLPRAYSDQFAMAQHSVPPLSYPLVVKTFRRQFGKDPIELFDTFERKAARGFDWTGAQGDSMRAFVRRQGPVPGSRKEFEERSPRHQTAGAANVRAKGERCSRLFP